MGSYVLEHGSRRPAVAQSVRYRLDDRGSNSGRGSGGIFLLATASRPVLAPTQPPMQWVLGPLTLGIKWPGREADGLLPSNAWNYTSTTRYVFMVWYLTEQEIRLHGVVLIMPRDLLPFY
jgi:hypothetical protein